MQTPGVLPVLAVLRYPRVCYLFLCVPHFSPTAPIFCARLTFRETAKAILTKGEGAAKCAKGIQNAHFLEAKKLAHSPACEEKHGEQDTPLHYTE